MKISIVIPNYNGENLLKKNLPKVIEAVDNEKYEIELVLIDDASVDNSIKVAGNILNRIKKSNFSFKILKNEVNLGFSSNVDKGVDASTGEILLLLNTDIIPEKGFLESLINHFKDSKIFAVGCMDKSVENGKIILRGRGIGSWQRGLLVHKRGEVNKTDTLWVSCGSGAFSREIWNRLGGLDRLYNPFYWEDIDLSYRALKSGYKVLFEPKSVVIHEHEKGAIKSKYSPFTIKTIAYRNQFIFVWKNLTDLGLFTKHIVLIPYYLAKAILGLDVALILGFFKALFLILKIIQSKSENKKLFVKKDKEIVSEFI
jgi:GT2 family glycosyltransferase